MAELSKHMQTCSDKQKGGNSDSDFDYYFPDFIYVIRDFNLKLEVDGEEVSRDEYLEHCLKPRNDHVKGYTTIREAIRKYFKSRKCFVFVSPASGSQMKHLDTLPNAKLDPEFRQQADEFVKHIFSSCPVKNLKGIPVTGTSKYRCKQINLIVLRQS